MQDLKDWQDLVIFFLLGLVMGLLAELAARRKIWIPTLQRLMAAVLGIVGGFLGSLVFNDLFGLLNEPILDHVSIVPVLIGTLLLLVPWWLIRSGRTKLSANQKWRKNYWRK
ncbi:MAG: hypothetical protein HXX08_12000 [Chloroflexi bacterium]|uniref:Uncharacterized protein n=1 Tax=Candidatus Chlorohelix allophototropha TaxID=3003348 RepID=A0A8T7LXA4_9CHLR|nr:hypothetical protein [Chloroflexota bacterium]WJW65964.1 hypothetical protein OZ401_001744 [Chloroflexota bacterium L227-S17]